MLSRSVENIGISLVLRSTSSCPKATPLLRECGEEVSTSATGGGRAAQGFAVDGDHQEVRGLAGPLRGPGAEDAVQTVRVDLVDGASEGRFTGHLAGDSEFDQRGRGGRVGQTRSHRRGAL